MGGVVAYVAFEPYPNAKGSGTRISQMVRALADTGRRVVLVTLPGRGTAVAPEGVEHIALPVFADNFLVRALEFRDQVARRLRAIRPDVVHVRGLFEGQAAAEYASQHGASLVWEVNGLPSVELPYHFPAVGRALDLLGRFRRDEAALLDAADVVCTQSQTTLAFLRGRGLAPDRPALVIPNGADPEAYPEVATLDAPGPPEVLYTGTLAPWQGIAELLMAARRCAQVGPVRFVLVGPIRRRWRRQLQRMTRRLKVTDVVEFTDALDRRDVAARIARSRVCVAPLRRDVRNRSQGCSPIKIFEYMAAGRPAVVTDLACTREIVGKDRGFFVAAPRPKLLSEAILGVLADEAGARAVGERARRWVDEHATWAHRRGALVRGYETFGLG